MITAQPLPGRMQTPALTVDSFLDFAARWHPQAEVVGRNADGTIERSDYARVHERARRFSGALIEMGIGRGDRVATFAMNGIRHLEAWYGIMGIGAVCHTLNPRLFREQLVYIVNHAQDRIILADASFAKAVIDLLPDCPTVERVILFADGCPDPAPAGTTDYDALVAAAPDRPVVWGGFDEQSACGLCYTSGTTGNPKGVLYSHRSNYLHTLTSLQHAVMNFAATDVVLPIVPMFHANAWGIAFSAPAVGAKLVMPGARLDGASVYDLIEREGVTFSAAVPTVWQGLLQHLQATGGTLPTLRRVVIGGAACPEAVIRAFEDDYGVEVAHAWGMTETSPIGTTAADTAATATLDPATRRGRMLKQGRPPFGIDLMLADDDGAEMPRDGNTPGRLMVRGGFVAQGYFGEADDAVNADGWFDTGDIATIDGDGFMQITDRGKDIIKSGGEWISSIEIENIAVGHPKAALAAVIGMPHEKWGERPLLLVKLKPGEQAEAAEFHTWLDGKIAKWWMPDAVRFVDTIPLGATGKIDKKRIRKEMAANG